MTVRYALLDHVPVGAEEAARASPRTLDPVPPGVYETVLVRDGLPALAPAHAHRHARGCAALGLEVPTLPRLLATLYDAAAKGGNRARLRMMRWAEPGGRTRSLVTVDEEPRPKRRATIAVAPDPRPDEGSDRYRHKRLDAPDLDRMRRIASAAGRLDVIVLDERGVVLEGARTNLFWRVEKTLFTPAATLPLLPGVRRAWLLDAARRARLETREVEATLDDVRDADEILATNAMLGVVRRVTLET